MQNSLMIFIEDFIFNSFIVLDAEDPSLPRVARTRPRRYKIGESLSGQNSRRKRHRRSHRLRPGPGNDNFINFSSLIKKIRS